MKASADPTRHRRLAVAGFALFFAAHYLAWISVSNAQNAPAAAAKGELKSKDAKDGKAAKPEEKPKPNIPRDQVIARPGGQRDVVPSFKISKKLPYVEPTPAAAKEFDEMRKDGKKLNGKALDAYAKGMVYMMTDPAKRAEISTHVEKILGPIRQAEGVGAANLNTQFLQAYKKLLIKYVRDLMDNHIAVKINGLLLLNDLYSGKADVEDGVPVVVDVLADKTQDDAVHYVAMKTLDNIKRIYPTAIKVENESKGADAVLAIATNPNVQGVLLEKAVETLGSLGRAFKGDLPDRVEIATFLANVALNEKLPLRTRVTAALSLGQLKVPQEIGWNFELQCFVIGKVLRELIDAANGGNVNAELFRFWVLVFREAVRNMEAQARNASPEMKQFADVFKPVIEALAPQNPMQPNLADLDQWLAAHQQPAKRKMAERGKDIVLNKP